MERTYEIGDRVMLSSRWEKWHVTGTIVSERDRDNCYFMLVDDPNAAFFKNGGRLNDRNELRVHRDNIVPYTQPLSVCGLEDIL